MMKKKTWRMMIQTLSQQGKFLREQMHLKVNLNPLENSKQVQVLSLKDLKVILLQICRKNIRLVSSFIKCKVCIVQLFSATSCKKSIIKKREKWCCGCGSQWQNLWCQKQLLPVHDDQHSVRVQFLQQVGHQHPPNWSWCQQCWDCGPQNIQQKGQRFV